VKLLFITCNVKIKALSIKSGVYFEDATYSLINTFKGERSLNLLTFCLKIFNTALDKRVLLLKRHYLLVESHHTENNYL